MTVNRIPGCSRCVSSTVFVHLRWHVVVVVCGCLVPLEIPGINGVPVHLSYFCDKRQSAVSSFDG